MIKAWNFQNFIIMSQETIFLTETLCTFTWVLTSAFFQLQIIFLQNMSTYILLEPQFDAGQSFLGNYGLKTYGFRDKGLKVHDDVIIFERKFLGLSGHILTYIPWNHNLMQSKVSLETMFWKFMVFEIQEVKVNYDVIIFQTHAIIFPNISICVSWILFWSKSSWDSDALF